MSSSQSGFASARGVRGSLLFAAGIAIALAVLFLPFLTSPWLTVWPAVLVFIVLCRINWGSRVAFLRALNEYHCLKIDSNDGEEDSLLPPVTLIAPARNEEAGIETAVRSMLELDYPSLRVTIVNDHSTDSTGEILDRLANENPRLRVIHNPPLQEGWHGKVNAMWHAVNAANPDCPWILQTDADAVFHPKALRRGMAYALRENLDYLTCVVWLDNKSLAEELVMPIAWCNILTRVRLPRINEPGAPAIGVGPFMLYRRDAYFAGGGHSAIVSQTPEDTLLAATFKQADKRVGAVWTRDMVRFRIYRGYAQLRRFLVRKFRISADDDIPQLVASAGAQVLRFVCPLSFAAGAALNLIAFGFSVPWTIYGVAALAAYITASLSFYRYEEVAYLRPGLAWAHPVGAVLRAFFATEAAYQAYFHKPMEWRGRRHINIRAHTRRTASDEE